MTSVAYPGKLAVAGLREPQPSVRNRAVAASPFSQSISALTTGCNLSSPQDAFSRTNEPLHGRSKLFVEANVLDFEIPKCIESIATYADNDPQVSEWPTIKITRWQSGKGRRHNLR